MVEVGLRLGFGLLRSGLGLGLHFRSAGRVGGFVEICKVKLILTQFVVEVEVGVELCNNADNLNTLN